ncbi:hypothetical protein ACFOHU_08145 [Ottowia pentelensis]|uniref:Tip attachment protein J domain-containing protein n=2 Tax=Ottowia pentelensis TaxID=511108 RepID=A0ABV6PTI5_9BURK
MPIPLNAVKLLASKVMDDVPEGGGGPTGIAIASGASNLIFTDVTGVDRAGGDTSLRQLHYQVQTADTQKALDMYLMIARRPADAAVDIYMVACDTFAVRTQIAQAIASYFIPASEWGGYLLEDHIKDQQNITVLQRPGTTLPAVGDTLFLILNEGQGGQVTQAVRVTNLASSEQTYTDTSVVPPVDFKGLRCILTLDKPLAQAFPGSPPSRAFARQAAKTKIRAAMAAGAARFYGAAASSAATAITDDFIKVDSIYAQVVPSSRDPRTNVGEAPGSQRTLVLAAAPRRVEVGVTPHSRRIKVGNSNVSTSYVLPVLLPLPEPGTVVVTYRAQGQKYSLVDDGAGHLVGGIGETGTIAYASGLGDIVLKDLPDIGSTITIHWGERAAYTNRSSQGASVRPPEYTWVLEGDGMLEPGTLTLQYTSGGVVKNCSVSAGGIISGDGAGRVDNPSKTVQFRPAYMIDAGGQIACEYQLSTLQTEILTPGSPDAGGFITLALAQQPAAGTVSVQWATAQEVSTTSGGTTSSTKTHTGGGASSVRAVQYVPQTAWTGQLTAIGISTTPGGGGVDFGAGFNNGGTQYIDVKTETSTSGSASYSTATGRDGATRVIVLHSVTDDGAGNLAAALGTVAYTSKSISLRVVDFTRSTESYKADYESASEFKSATTSNTSSSSGSASAVKGGSYATTAVGEQQLAASSVVVRYKVGAVTPVAASMTFTPPEVVIDLCPYTADRIVPGSVQFTWMGKVYQDVDGVLYRDRAGASPGIASGSIDLQAGLARMTDYVVGGSGPADFTLQSLWTRKGDWRTASIFAQTQASPIQPGPGGFSMLLVDVAGAALTAVVDVDGNVTGTHCLGKLDFEFGDLQLQFGDYVLDSALTPADKLEWWYAAADVGAVEAGKIWRPWPVDPASLRMNYVSYAYLPLDEEIIRMPATTLPPDGRVPKFRVGDYISIDDAQQLAAATYAASDVIDCGRTRLSAIALTGADGAPITAGYTADLDAGTIAVADVSGWSQPVTVTHWLGVMARAREVRIDGTIRLNKQLGHAFPSGANVASLLMAGDKAARVQRVFDQQTWDKTTWLDSRSGASAAFRYNDTDYPIAVTNQGAVTERFALQFKSNGSDFDCLGEHLGYVAAGSKNTDFAPINPRTGAPYFTMPAAGWGASAWTAGNTVFVHTVGAMASFAIGRSVQPSEAPVALDYSFELHCRYFEDRPPGP